MSLHYYPTKYPYFSNVRQSDFFSYTLLGTEIKNRTPTKYASTNNKSLSSLKVDKYLNKDLVVRGDRELELLTQRKEILPKTNIYGIQFPSSLQKFGL